MLKYTYLIKLDLKTVTEILPFSDVAESRRLVQADTNGLGSLLPESVLSKRKRVMRHVLAHVTGRGLIRG